MSQGLQEKKTSPKLELPTIYARYLQFTEKNTCQNSTSEDAHLVTLGVFKQALIKKHGNLVRGFRTGLANDQLILPKTQFLKLGLRFLGGRHDGFNIVVQ